MPTGSKIWTAKNGKIVRDGSIHPECRRRSVLIGETYKVELNSPKLEYGEMEKAAGGCPFLTPRRRHRKRQLWNARPCGRKQAHAAEFKKTVLSIMYSKEDILFAALKVNPARIDSYCQAWMSRFWKKSASCPAVQVWIN